MPILWEVTTDESVEIKELMCRADNREISEVEFAETLALMPNYPLPRLPTTADDFKIVVRNHKVSVSGKGE